MSGSSPAVHGRLVQGLERGRGRRDRAPREGHDQRPLLPHERLRPRRRFTFDRKGLPQRHGSDSFSYVCEIPRVALDPAAPPKARPSLYGHGLLGSAEEIDAGNVEAMANEHNFVFCATDLGGLRRAGPRPHRERDVRLLEVQHRRRPHAAGLREPDVPRAGADPPAGALVERRLPEERAGRDRHAPPVLRRQLPGRNHGRSAHGTRARLRPRRARRAGHELLDAVAAQRRLRRVRPDHLRRLPERARAPALARVRSSCSGTAASRTATRSTSRAGRSRARPSTRF